MQPHTRTAHKVTWLSGTALFLFGILFYMQSHGLAGPQESFMYENPQWTGYGLAIAIIGIVVLAAGVISYIKNRR